MATKQTWKRRIQKILSDNSRGIFSDNSWEQVHKIFAAVNASEAVLYVGATAYRQNEDGTPVEKKWLFTVEVENFIFQGVLTAHGAGSVKDPLDRYDISAYIS